MGTSAYGLGTHLQGRGSGCVRGKNVRPPSTGRGVHYPPYAVASVRATEPVQPLHCHRDCHGLGLSH